MHMIQRKNAFQEIDGERCESLQNFVAPHRMNIESNFLSNIIIRTLDGAVPYYLREEPGQQRLCYLLPDVAATLADLIETGREAGIVFPTEYGEKNGGQKKIASAFLSQRLQVSNLWKGRSRPVPLRRGKTRRVHCPPLPWPGVQPTSATGSRLERKGLLDHSSVIKLCMDSMQISTLLIYDVRFRPLEARNTQKHRRLLIEKQVRRCDVCHDDREEHLLVDNGRETHVHHKKTHEEFTKLVMAGKLDIPEATLKMWSRENVAAVHTTCNNGVHRLKCANRKKKP